MSFLVKNKFFNIFVFPYLKYVIIDICSFCDLCQFACINFTFIIDLSLKMIQCCFTHNKKCNHSSLSRDNSPNTIILAYYFGNPSNCFFHIFLFTTIHVYPFVSLLKMFFTVFFSISSNLIIYKKWRIIRLIIALWLIFFLN
jgi:hypothetical protein